MQPSGSPPKPLGDLSNEQVECFHHDFTQMEVQYQEWWYAAILADYCWSIKRDNTL